jgi:hypothetical protein
MPRGTNSCGNLEQNARRMLLILNEMILLKKLKQKKQNNKKFRDFWRTNQSDLNNLAENQLKNRDLSKNIAIISGPHLEIFGSTLDNLGFLQRWAQLEFEK